MLSTFRFASLSLFSPNLNNLNSTHDIDDKTMDPSYTSQYLRMYPVKDFEWEKLFYNLDEDKSLEVQQKFLEQTLYHPIAVEYPPTAAYTRLFLKTLISKLEDLGHTVDEEVYCAYTRLLACSQGQEDDLSYFRTYFVTPSIIITMHETGQLVADGTTGLYTWEAGHVMSQWCLDNAHIFTGKKILELGAGLGLLGLVVIKGCQPAGYTFSDHHPAVLKALSGNLTRNLGGHTISSSDKTTDLHLEYEGTTEVDLISLDWEDDCSHHGYDIILGADLIFDKSSFKALTGTLKDLLGPKKIAYFGCTLRNKDTFDLFKETVVSSGLVCKVEKCLDYQVSQSQPRSTVCILSIST
ncbi:protein-lysine N-methyltransferase EEF2KMT-like isoform X1 [Oratosquilla oratoria]|uniref:protein-lysine N-methyltransferase EEF2KMT-like isoform X1 n=1 Tax=Oratosquilla oratoria TaxID=337810 RepID=UPI003F75E8A4